MDRRTFAGSMAGLVADASLAETKAQDAETDAAHHGDPHAYPLALFPYSRAGLLQRTEILFAADGNDHVARAQP